MKKRKQKRFSKTKESADLISDLKVDSLSRIKKNRSPLLRALHRINATQAVINYCGSGDSGQIESVTIYNNNVEIKPEKKVRIFVEESNWDDKERKWIKRMKLKFIPIKDALEDFVYDWINSEHSGWENNDGASGECTIEVGKRTFVLGHTTYFTESEYSENHL